MLLLTFVTLELVERTASRQVEAEIGQSLAELAFQTTDKLDQGMYERYREVKLIAERYEITNPDVPAEVKRGVLEGMQETYPYYAWIGLADNAGKVKISTKRLLEGADVSKRPWWGTAYQGQNLHDVHEAVLLAKLLPNPGGEPKRFFDIAFPYRGQDGKIAGVLGTHLSWQWAAHVEQSVLRPLAERKAVDTLILSKGGLVLLGPKAYADKVLTQGSLAEAHRGMNGSVIETWPDGKRYLVGYSQSRGYRSYPGLGWTVLVRQPVEEAYRPVQALKRKILHGGLGAAVLVPLLVWALARTISRPLQTITRHADELRAGAATELPPLRSRLVEVQILHRALNALLTKVRTNEKGLRELNAHLETRVIERTAELHAAVEETRAGEERVKAIIETAHDAFVGADADGRITDWNPRAEEIFGWTRQEALGRTVTETIIPLRFRDAHDHGMRRFSATGNSTILNKRLQLHALRRNGEEFPVEMTIGLISAGSTHFFGAFVQDISERTRIGQELARERELLDAVLDSIDVGVVVCGQDGEISLFNRAARDLHGLPAEPVAAIDQAIHYGLFEADGTTPMAPQRIPLIRALAGELVENSEVVVKPVGAPPRFLFASGRALHAGDGSNIGAVIALKDVTALKEAARRLEASERSLRTITDNVPVLISYIDRDERYGFANATYETWHGIPVAGIIGKTVADVLGKDTCARYQEMLRKNLAGNPVRFETTVRGPDGVRIVEVTGIPDIQDGACHGVYMLSSDITQAKRHADELSRLARIDTLTGLPNRRSHDERLQEALRRGRRTGNAVALMFLDVDHFKQVNDTLGHAAGDTVLHEFARRVKAAVRVTDTVCRLAGDEFTVILEGLKSPDEAALVARKIVAAFERPFALPGAERRVTASIGVAYAAGFPADAALLGAEADKALYAAKDAGRARYALRRVLPAAAADVPATT
jgi:diguanylate cyclase (GGDEF)-like protein/PAS domain S-box-containing protein